MKQILFIAVTGMFWSCIANELPAQRKPFVLKDNRRLIDIAWEEDCAWITTEDTITGSTYADRRGLHGEPLGEIRLTHFVK